MKATAILAFALLPLSASAGSGFSLPIHPGESAIGVEKRVAAMGAHTSGNFRIGRDRTLSFIGDAPNAPSGYVIVRNGHIRLTDSSWGGLDRATCDAALAVARHSFPNATVTVSKDGTFLHEQNSSESYSFFSFVDHDGRWAVAELRTSPR